MNIQKFKRFELRIPDNLHKDVKEIAKAEGRSMQKEILFIVEKYVKSWKAMVRRKDKN